MIDGLAVVDKPAGMTSHDVVARCRGVFGQRKVGHAGTLDPDATGVLLVGLGRATRLLQFLAGLPKSYTAEVVLGVTTSTLDEGGEVTGRWSQGHVTLVDARREAEALTGSIQQVPPMVSAVKVGGRRLHELARAGVDVERPSRTVTVTRFEVSETTASGLPHGGGPVFAIEVDCSSGTYIRTLAADLGFALGGGAYLRRLRRIAVGPWPVASAVALDDLDAAHVLEPAAALPGLSTSRVGAELAGSVRNGQVLTRESLGVSGDGPWKVLDRHGYLLAVYSDHGDGRAKPVVVLAGDSPRDSRTEPLPGHR